MMGPLSLYRAYKKMQERDLQLRLLDTHAEKNCYGHAVEAVRELRKGGHMEDPLVKPIALSALDRFAGHAPGSGLDFAMALLVNRAAGALHYNVVTKSLSLMDAIMQDTNDRENTILLIKSAQACGTIMNRLSVETALRGETEKRWHTAVEQLATLDIRRALAECASYSRDHDANHYKPAADMWTSLARAHSETNRAAVVEEGLRIILTPEQDKASRIIRQTVRAFLEPFTAPRPQPAPQGGAAQPA